MGGCHSEISTKTVNAEKNVNRSKTVMNRNAIYFSKKGEKLSDLKGYEDSPSQKIELFVFLKDVEFAVYEAELKMVTSNIMTVLGKTKEVEGNSIDFMTSFTLNYYFEKEQKLYLNLRKNHNKLETIELTVGRIMGSMGQRVSLPIQNSNGQVILQAQAIKSESWYADINITYNCLDNSVSEPYYLIKRDISAKGNTQLVNAYKSEVRSGSRNFVFNKFSLETSVLNDNDNNKAFFVEIYDGNKTVMIGFQRITLSNVFENNLNSHSVTKTIKLELEGLNKQIIAGHSLDITITLTKKYRFVDFLAGGLQISLIIGIDFTASNRPIHDKSSLHYIQNGYQNNYEKAIISCGSIVAYYDYDQMFPVFGYGARLSQDSDVNHCFPVNFSNDPNIYTIPNIVPAYRDCLTKIVLFGPTYFEPIIRTTIQIAKSSSKDVYHILMILTDGQINDPEGTVDALVEASFLPVSVIIIGIGNGNFSTMELLDADVNPLKSSNGTVAARDLVQFVEFSKFQNDGVKLAEQVLEEVPGQVEEFFRIVKRPPNPAIKID